MTIHIRLVTIVTLALLLYAAAPLHAGEPVTLGGVVRVQTHRDQVRAIHLDTPAGSVPLLLNHTARRLAPHDGKSVRVTGRWRLREDERIFEAESFSTIPE